MWRAQSGHRGVSAGLGLMLLTLPLWAKPSVWQRVRDPKADERAELLLRADRKREPMDATFDSPAIRVQLHRAAATWLELAGVEMMDDVDLLYLFGECLAFSGPAFHARAKAVIQHALQLAPEHSAAPQALFQLSRVAASLEDYALQYDALERMFQREWRHEVRVEALLDQGQGAMASGKLERALERLQGALSDSTEPRQWALAQWTLAVAMDRALLGPQAANLAHTASLASFGSSGQADVLALPDATLSHPWEAFYYRALALMGKARVVSAEKQVATYQDAKFLWLRYLDASGESKQWHPRVQQHLRMIERITMLDADEQEDLDALVAATPSFPAEDAGVDPLWPEELEQGERFWGADAGSDGQPVP